MSRGNLPQPTASFVGRRNELKTLETRFAQGQRLITLLGPGGSGKTRLATEYGRLHREEYPGGVWFFELTPFRSGQEAIEAARIQFKVNDLEGPALEAIATTIEEDGAALFIVDNLEHLAVDFAHAISAFMQLSPSTQVIVTSREPLHILGEFQMRLGGIQPTDAVELFALRAASHVPDFTLDDSSTEAVLELANRVDYLPLAIELAAARVSLLSPASLVERLTHRMTALKSKDRDRPERHQTIAATIDWSWELLPEHQRDALLRLTPIRGAFSITDAEVLAGNDVLDTLAELLDSSMIERVGDNHFRILETVRGFARNKLLNSELASAVFDAHATYFTGLVFQVPRQNAMTLRRLLPNLMDISGNPQVSPFLRAKASVAAGRVVHDSGNLGEILNLLQAVEQQVDQTPEQQAILAEALLLCSNFHYENRTLKLAQDFAQRATEVATASGNKVVEVLARSVLALCVASTGDLKTALRDMEAVFALAQQTNDPQLPLSMRGNLAMIAFAAGEMTHGTALLAENLAEAEILKATRLRARTLTNLGVAAVAQGHASEARRYFMDAAGLLEELGDLKFQAVALASLADLERHDENPAAAIPLYERAIEVCRACGLSHIEARALAGRGSLYQDAADRGYLVKAMEIVEDESDSRDSQFVRSLLLCFDLWFENDPLARHQARQILDIESVPSSWKAVVAALLGLSYAIRHDFDAARTMLDKADNYSELGFSNVFVAACTALMASIQSPSLGAPTSALELLSRTDAGQLGTWPHHEARRVLKDLARRYAPQSVRPMLRITEDGRKFIPPGQEEAVDFTRRGALRMILLGLARVRQENPGEGVSLDDVLELGWPGERVTPEAAASRVYTAIRTLRGFGLDEYLLTTHQGYLLSADLDIAFQDI